MTVGYRVGAQCFETVQNAVDSYWSSMPVAVAGRMHSGEGEDVMVHSQAQLIAGIWTGVTDRCSGSSTTVTCTRAQTALPGFNPLTCELTKSDGVILGWGVVFVVVVVFSITVLRRSICL